MYYLIQNCHTNELTIWARMHKQKEMRLVRVFTDNTFELINKRTIHPRDIIVAKSPCYQELIGLACLEEL